MADDKEEFIPGAADPSDAQKSAGNYRKGHRFLHGMRFSVENAAGTQRRGKDKAGNPWESTLTYDYGYVRGSKGKDKDHVDAWLGPNHNGKDAKVFVIDQNGDDGAFDEHKSLIGFDDAEHAVDAYMSNYPSGWKGMSAVTELSLPEFRKWVYKGKDQGKRLPVSQMVSFKDRAIVPNENYAGGGAVGKAAKRLAEVLREHGVEGVLHRVQEMVDRTNRTGDEHSLWGWTENAGGMNENRSFVGRQPQLTQGDKESVKMARPEYMDRSDRLQFLTAHSHPMESTPVPSDKDMALNNAIAGYGKDNKALVVQQGRDRIGHSTIDIPGASLEDNPVTSSKNIASIADILREAQRKGYYDPYLKDAGIDPALDSWRIPSMRNYMAGALWEPEGLARYAHDIPSVSRGAHEAAMGRGEKGTFYSPDPELMNKIIDRTWDPTRELLNDNRRRLNFAEGGSVRFPDGAMVNERGLQDHFKAGGADEHCSCGNGTKMFAEGGAVEEDLTRPAFRTPMIARRREDRQDREGAKQVPASLVRGALAGTLGFGGDIEGLLRTIASITNKDLDTTPVLPTGDFYRDILPGKPTSKAGQAFEELGAAAGVPLSAATLGGVRLAQRGLPVAKGALSTVAERLATPAEPLVAGRRMGSPQQRQTGAVKMPGGNFVDPRVETAAKEARGWESERMADELAQERRNWEQLGPEYQADMRAQGLAPDQKPMSIPDWMEKRTKQYIKKDLGTPTDPLLKLEAEGLLHMKPEQVAEGARHGRYAEGGRGGVFNEPPDPEHQRLTGRAERTPWERLADDQLVSTEASRAGSYFREPPAWLDKLDGDTPIWSPGNPSGLADNLGFNHIRDYLDQATWGHDQVRLLPDAPNAAREQRALGVPNEALERALRMENEGLNVDPAKLDRMSLVDVARLTGQWNKALDKWAEEAAAAKDWNKGVKQVLKQYPDSDLQWAELSPEALADEGFAMGHCVGGYCPQVEGGSTRILSLRDKKGPHVTVELQKPDIYRQVADQSSPAAKALAEEGERLGLSDNDFWKFVNKRAEENSALFPWQIRQIKGKGNLAPVAEYQPAVQDLVRNMGPWAEDIRDLQNTGLRRSQDAFNVNELGVLRGLGKEPGEFLNPKEIEELQREFNSTIDRGVVDSYASGGPVLGPQTVGLGTYAPSAQGRAAPQQPQSGSPVNPYNAQAQQPVGESGLLQMGAGMSGMTLDPRLLAQMPTWNLNDPGAEADIKEYTRGANAGVDYSGANAFLRAGPTEIHASSGDVDPGNRVTYDPASMGGYRSLMSELGLKDQSPWAPGTPGGEQLSVNANMAKMNDLLKDYRLITGLTRDTGDADLRTTEAIYKNVNGQLTPMAGRFWQRPEDKGFLRSESGGSLLQAFMTALPAVGGYAGLIGQAGSAAAPYINAAGGALMGGAMGGTQGALSSLLGSAGGYLGGQAGSYLGGTPGQSIGQQAGSYFGKKAAERV